MVATWWLLALPSMWPRCLVATQVASWRNYCLLLPEPRSRSIGAYAENRTWSRLEGPLTVTASEPRTELPRRTVLAAGVVGVAGAALAACGGSSSSESTTSASASPTTPSEAGTPSPTAGGGAAGADIGAASQVPVGGAVIIAANDTAFVVAQPTEGEFVAHSAVCPHQGCLCNRISDGEAVCPCHGSKFNAVTGAVQQGPATSGLAAAQVTVENGQLFVS